MLFSRRRWATRVVEKAGFPSGSGEARVLIDLLMRASRENSQQLPTAEQVFFAALRLFHDKAAVARVAKNLKSRNSPLNSLLPSFLRQQLISPLIIEWSNSWRSQGAFIFLSPSNLGHQRRSLSACPNTLLPHVGLCERRACCNLRNQLAQFRRSARYAATPPPLPYWVRECLPLAACCRPWNRQRLTAPPADPTAVHRSGSRHDMALSQRPQPYVLRDLGQPRLSGRGLPLSLSRR